MSSQRLFAAAVPDDAARAMLAQHLERSLAGGMPGKAVPPANWHATLRFFGTVDEVRADRLRHELSAEIGGGGFTVRLGGLGAFPRAARGAVLWVAVTRGADRLAVVAAACEEAAQAAGLDSEERPFHPHLTLSRLRPPVDVRGVIDAVPPAGIEFQVDSVVLFESRLARSGAMYQEVERYPL